MSIRAAFLWFLIASLAGCASSRFGASPVPRDGGQVADDQVEPSAGGWKTWVLASGSQLRPAPPPDALATASELKELHAMGGRRDAAARDLIAFWDSGAPGYRWNGVLADELARHKLAGATTSRL